MRSKDKERRGRGEIDNKKRSAPNKDGAQTVDIGKRHKQGWALRVKKGANRYIYDAAGGSTGIRQDIEHCNSNRCAMG